MGMIHVLEPSIRSRFENLITFFHLGTSLPKNDLFCEKYFQNFRDLMINGLDIELKNSDFKITF